MDRTADTCSSLVEYNHSCFRWRLGSRVGSRYRMGKSEVRRAQFHSLMSEAYQRKHVRCSSFTLHGYQISLLCLTGKGFKQVSIRTSRTWSLPSPCWLADPIDQKKAFRPASSIPISLSSLSIWFGARNRASSKTGWNIPIAWSCLLSLSFTSTRYFHGSIRVKELLPTWPIVPIMRLFFSFHPCVCKIDRLCFT
jgi:hypothetical protein